MPAGHRRLMVGARLSTPRRFRVRKVADGHSIAEGGEWRDRNLAQMVKLIR